jgi:SAM-dependent methyltransferase
MASRDLTLFRPVGKDCSISDIGHYFLNFLTEWEQVQFDAAERAALSHVKILGRLLDPGTRDFFLYHFGPPVQRALRVFFARNPRPRILELGSGSGNFSILCALLGAEVVGVDLDPVMVAAGNKRKLAYEEAFGLLGLRFIQADAFKFLSESAGEFDGVHLLFSFNNIQPSRRLLALVSRALSGMGTVIITDGSQQSIVNRLFRRRNVLWPRAVEADLHSHGVTSTRLEYGCVTAPSIFSLLPERMWYRTEQLLSSMQIMAWVASSYTLVATRPDAETAP